MTKIKKMTNRVHSFNSWDLDDETGGYRGESASPRSSALIGDVRKTFCASISDVVGRGANAHPPTCVCSSGKKKARDTSSQRASAGIMQGQLNVQVCLILLVFAFFVTGLVGYQVFSQRIARLDGELEHLRRQVRVRPPAVRPRAAVAHESSSDDEQKAPQQVLRRRCPAPTDSSTSSSPSPARNQAPAHRTASPPSPPPPPPSGPPPVDAPERVDALVTPVEPPGASQLGTLRVPTPDEPRGDATPHLDVGKSEARFAAMQPDLRKVSAAPASDDEEAPPGDGLQSQPQDMRRSRRRKAI